MLCETVDGCENLKVSFIGAVSEFKDDFVVLKCNENSVKVKYSDLEQFKHKNVMVEGTVENGLIVADCVFKVEDEFDFQMYRMAINAMKMSTEIY